INDAASVFSRSSMLRRPNRTSCHRSSRPRHLHDIGVSADRHHRRIFIWRTLMGSRLAQHRRARMRIAGICFYLLFGAWRLFAGQTEASIIGQLKDESGSVLPGVTVVAKSPSLQVPALSAVTNEVGDYRLAPLPIGVYEISYELSGFQSARRENVRLTLGFTAKIDVVLKVGAMEETVTVSGASPVVDIASTTTSTQLT